MSSRCSLQTGLSKQSGGAPAWIAARWVVVLLLGAHFSACEHFPSQEPSNSPRHRLLKSGQDVEVTIRRLAAPPRHFLTSARDVNVHLFLDPSYTRAGELRQFALWGRSPADDTWRLLGTCGFEEAKIDLSVEEGQLGLWASGTDRRGRPVHAPVPGAEPYVWLVVDRTPPSISWLQPLAETRVDPARPLELSWTANEVHFGDNTYQLEWSADRKKWQPIASLKALPGHRTHSWMVPANVPEEFVVRLKTQDLAGHLQSQELTLRRREPLMGSNPAVGVAAERGQPDKGTGETGGSGTAPAIHQDGAKSADAPETRVSQDLSGEAAARRVSAVFALEPPAACDVRGGSELHIAWRGEGIDPQAPVALEWRRDAEDAWHRLGEEALEAGVIRWKVPCEDGAVLQVRARVAGPQGDVEARFAEPLSVRCPPTRVRLLNREARFGERAQLNLALPEKLASLTADEVRSRVGVFVRRLGVQQWTELEPRKVAANRPGYAQMEVSFLSFEDGAYELCFKEWMPGPAVREIPESTVVPESRFELDRTPPELLVEGLDEVWVEGGDAEVTIRVAIDDAKPPVVIEGRDSDGRWVELARWPNPLASARTFRWRLRAGAGEYSLRVSVADAVGNRKVVDTARRPVVPAIRLSGIDEGSVLTGENVNLRWSIHPQLAAVATDARVNVYHRQGEAAWEKIYADLKAFVDLYWDLPEQTGADHQLRLELVHKGVLLSVFTSKPFTIERDDVKPITPQEKSKAYLDLAVALREEYRTKHAAVGGTPNAALQKLAEDIIQNYTRAFELDKTNDKASYAIAQFLQQLNLAENEAEVRRWLQLTTEVNPDHFWALNDLAALEIRANEFANAEKYLRRAVAIQPKGVVRFNLGLALFYRNKLGEARHEFDMALKTGESDVPEGDVYYYIVHSYLQEDNQAEAKAVYEENRAKISASLRKELEELLNG